MTDEYTGPEFTDTQGRTWRWRFYDFTESPSLFAIAFDAKGGELTDEVKQVEPADTEQSLENLQKAAEAYDAEHPSALQPVAVQPYLTLLEFRRATAHLPGDVPIVIEDVIEGVGGGYCNARIDPAGVPDEWPDQDARAIILTTVDNMDKTPELIPPA
jgi:hypothetical protein